MEAGNATPPADDPGGDLMGRSFESVRQGVNNIVDRWERSARALKREDQQYAQIVVDLARKHSSEAFVACNDPLEAAVFSALIELVKRQEQSRSTQGKNVDP